MYIIRKKFKFEAAHILKTAYSKACSENIHGHSYIVEVFLTSERLNGDGMVVDFGILTELMKPILESWDHALFISADDSRFEEGEGISLKTAIPGKVIPLESNPTAETMARAWFCILSDRLRAWQGRPERVRVLAVRVHETESGWAQYSEGNAFFIG